MPFIHVSMRKGVSEDDRRAISNSIHRGMIEAMGIPDDDFFQLTHELDEANFNFDSNYFGIARSEKMVFIQMFFNARPASVKEIIFKTIADRLVESPGLRRQDIIMNIVETSPESWWIEGRQINPRTGTDSRM